MKRYSRIVSKSVNFVYIYCLLCIIVFDVCCVICESAPCGTGAPLFLLVHLLPHLFPLFYFSLSFIGFTYFLLLSIPSFSTRIVPLRFQAGGRSLGGDRTWV